MKSIKTVKDIKVLRQMALLLEQENKQLTAKVTELINEIAMLKGEGEQGAKLRLEELEQQLAVLQKRLYGDSSEKRPPQPAQPQEPKPASEKKPRTGHGPREQPRLPVRDELHTLDTADKTCPACGGTLEPWEGQFEQSEEITVIRRRFEILRHKRQKYRCKCAGCIETAPAPLKLCEGARYSIDFAVEVVVDKYNEHMPLERQVRSMVHDGLIIDSQTLWDQVWTMTEIVKPAYDRLPQHQWSHPVLGADETTWRLMGKHGKPDGGSKRCYVWSIVSPKAVYYHILESRSANAAEKVLSGYKGIVIVDGYEGYPALAKRVGFIVVNCWAHVRREYLDVQKFFPEPAGQALDLIGKLYTVEHQCPAGPEGDERRAALRATESKAIVEQIHRWALSTPVLPESGLGKAIKYMLGRWDGLTRFLDDPRIPLDNNATERALRNVVIGRKNHYGSRSQRGLIAASVLYSLIDTAVMEKLNPREYLSLAVRRGLLGLPVPLPHEVAAELRAPPPES